jgi:hypothetical protein
MFDGLRKQEPATHATWFLRSANIGSKKNTLAAQPRKSSQLQQTP